MTEFETAYLEKLEKIGNALEKLAGETGSIAQIICDVVFNRESISVTLNQ